MADPGAYMNENKANRFNYAKSQGIYENKTNMYNYAKSTAISRKKA